MKKFFYAFMQKSYKMKKINFIIKNGEKQKKQLIK